MTKLCLAAVVAGLLAISLGSSAVAQGSPCDRGCLTGLVDSYVAAMVAHDPSRVAIARTVKYTENTGVLTVGEGLWIGASEAPTGFKIYVPDPSIGQVGYFGVLKEFDRPVLLALRLKVQNRQITEAEHIIARTLNEPGLKNLAKPRPALLADVPAAERTPRQEMLRIANSYYDSILQSSGKVTPYADDCVRHENGMVTSGNRAPQPGPPPGGNVALARIGALTCAAAMDTRGLSYITGIDLRRVETVDEQKGLVFGLTMFRHRGNVRTIKILNVPGVDTIPMNFGPIDLQAGHIFKIYGGKLHEIEAMGYLLPYKSDTGW
jgi:hypothetical protein